MKNPWILISLLCLTLQTHLSTATDRITTDIPLSGDVFVLGFFRPPAANSTSYYIGIWYNQSIVSEQTIVWVTNRGSPVSDRFCVVRRSLGQEVRCGGR
ncbi:G-type lectin S-receptor-like serine/threonine-protein kinase At4g11900 [Linum perenne]